MRLCPSNTLICLLLCFQILFDCTNCTAIDIIDDTTIVNYDTAHNKLLNASEILLDWFESNNLKANPTKFQLIVFEESNVERILVVHGANIQSSSSGGSNYDSLIVRTVAFPVQVAYWIKRS